MPITATTPTTVPASEEAVYPYWWITSFQIDGSNPDNVIARVSVRKYRIAPVTVTKRVPLQDANGVQVVDASGTPLFQDQTTEQQGVDYCPEPAIDFAISDVLGVAENNATIASVVGAILAGVQTYGTNQGIL